MSTRAKQIMTTVAKAMQSANWKYGQMSPGPASPVMISFGLAHYGSVTLGVSYQPDSEALVIAASQVYVVNEGVSNKGLVMETLLAVNWRTSFARFEMDPADGEVRLAVEIPLSGDAQVTEGQVLAGIYSVLGTLDSSHADIQRALGRGNTKAADETGAVSEPKDTVTAPNGDLDSMLASILGGQELPVPAEATMAVDNNHAAQAAGQHDRVEMPQILRDLVSFHPLTQFDEDTFLRLLEGSLSLSLHEKQRVIDAVPTLSQFQIDELLKVFREEVAEFEKLMPKESATIEQLEHDKAVEWLQLARNYAAELVSRLATAEDGLFTQSSPASDIHSSKPSGAKPRARRNSANGAPNEGSPARA